MGSTNSAVVAAPEVESTDPSVTAGDAATLVEEEPLVEEISIDGMCGVY